MRLLATFLAAWLIGLGAALAADPTSQPAANSPAGNWPGFRGPDPSGQAPNAGDPLIQIDPARDLRFKVPVPAKGQSSPIIWGDRIFLTGQGRTLTAPCGFYTIRAVLQSPNRILAFDRASGALLWNVALDAPAPILMPGDAEFLREAEQSTKDTGQAAPTPVTDGQRVYAFFGSSVLGAVDYSGRQVWAKRLVAGAPRSTYGLAASPVLYGDLVIQVVDLGKDPADGRSFIVAVRAKDGLEVWRKDRPVGSSWSTPLLAHLPEGDTLLTTSNPWLIAYDPKTGEERWRVGKAGDNPDQADEESVSLTGDVAASPIVCGNEVLAPSGESGQLLAVKPGGQGDVTKTNVLWHKSLSLPDVASPACDGKRYLHISSGGDLYCLDPANGEQVWKAMMKGQFWASPVVAAGRIYAINYEGVVYVISTDGKLLATSNLGEQVTASPAILAGRIYVRTAKYLMCLGRP